MSLLPAQQTHCPITNFFVRGKSAVWTHNETCSIEGSYTSSVVACHPVSCLYVTVGAALCTTGNAGAVLTPAWPERGGCVVCDVTMATTSSLGHGNVSAPSSPGNTCGCACRWPKHLVPPACLCFD